MAGHRAGHLSRHVLNEMAGSAAGHDGVVGKSPPLSALVYPDSEGFWGYRAQGWCGGGREIKTIPRFQRNMGILLQAVSGPCVSVKSRPLYFGWQAHQDRLDIAPGLKPEQRSAIVDQVE